MFSNLQSPHLTIFTFSPLVIYVGTFGKKNVGFTDL